jgi:glutamate formiminotransferase
MKGWLECVPNFSEGRNPEVLVRLRQAITAVRGTVLLDETADADHNRSVFTFVGPPDPVGESLLRAAAIAVEAIDLRSHQGCHPRIGALDVVPFVPLDESDREAAVALARRIGAELWQRLRVPVYFYGDAAMSAARRLLEDVRRGQFEGLSERLPADVIRRPDIGGDVLHPTAGATAIGVRRFLIAFNIDLETTDVDVARQIARHIRASSGGLPFVKALGLPLPSRGRTQVSMNLTNFEQTPLPAVFEAVRREAERLGTKVACSEIIGLAPRAALANSDFTAMRIEPSARTVILEERLAELLDRGP